MFFGIWNKLYCKTSSILFFISEQKLYVKLFTGWMHSRLRETLCLLSRCMQERGPLTSRTSAWVVWHSCSNVAWLSRLGEREAGQWKPPLFCGLILLASSHSSLVKCSVSYHGTNSAPSSRPCD